MLLHLNAIPAGRDGSEEPENESSQGRHGFIPGKLAELVGVTCQTIGMIEAGKYNPTLNLCVAIRKALHKTLDELFWEEQQEI